MVSVTSALRYIKSASRFHPHYQSWSSMFICGLIPRIFAEYDEAVPIDSDLEGGIILFYPHRNNGFLLTPKYHVFTFWKNLKKDSEHPAYTEMRHVLQMSCYFKNSVISS